MRIRDWSSDVCSSDLGPSVAYRQRDLSSWRPLRVCRWQRSRAVPAQFRYFRFHQSEALRTYLLNRREGLCHSWNPETGRPRLTWRGRSEEHTSELQSLMRISYAVFCLKKKNKQAIQQRILSI